MLQQIHADFLKNQYSLFFDDKLELVYQLRINPYMFSQRPADSHAEFRRYFFQTH